jgi:hypothetical protein
MKYISFIVLGKVRDNNYILRVSKTVSNCHCVNINVKRRDHEPFNRPICLYKNQHHANYYCKCKLSTDIEKNPGPAMLIDPNKTIKAPYSQGNVAVFGMNAGNNVFL